MVLLNTPGLKIKGHVEAIGHAQSTQPNTPTLLNQPNMPIPLNQPKIPCNFSQGLLSMCREHPCLNMHIEPPRTFPEHI